MSSSQVVAAQEQARTNFESTWEGEGSNSSSSADRQIGIGWIEAHIRRESTNRKTGLIILCEQNRIGAMCVQ